MTSRRPVHRKQERRSISRTGLLFCMLLAAGVMLVPIGSDFVRLAKTKVRDLALSSGLVDFNDCVVTSDRAIACNSRAVGTPLPAALRQMEDIQAQAAVEKKQRERAEIAVRELALEVARLSAQTGQTQFADKTGRFPPLVGGVTPTGMSGTTQTEPRDESAVPFSLTPPPESE